MFTAFHLKTDGQAEIVNQKTKRFFFERMLIINKITRTISFLKQKLQ
jgi:hypothetical protein